MLFAVCAALPALLWGVELASRYQERLNAHLEAYARASLSLTMVQTTADDPMGEEALVMLRIDQEARFKKIHFYRTRLDGLNSKPFSGPRTDLGTQQHE